MDIGILSGFKPDQDSLKKVISQSSMVVYAHGQSLSLRQDRLCLLALNAGSIMSFRCLSLAVIGRWKFVLLYHGLRNFCNLIEQ